MKKLLITLLVITAFACQPEKARQPVAETVAPATPAPTIAPQSKPPLEEPLPVLFTAADTLSAPMQKLLGEVDLSPLWRCDTEERRLYPVLEGFFGPDHYRFSLAIMTARRDAQHPDIYHVQGRTHYRKNIRPFEGILTVRTLDDAQPFYSPSGNAFFPSNQSMPPDTFQARYEAALSRTMMISLRAQMQLHEQPAKNSGIFEGEAFLNFYITPSKQVGYTSAPSVTPGEPANGSYILLRGARRNSTTGQVKSFVVADDAFAAAPDVLKDFGIGDRGQTMNPKYAKQGWNEKWENEEWWAEPGKPSLNL